MTAAGRPAVALAALLSMFAADAPGEPASAAGGTVVLRRAVPVSAAVLDLAVHGDTVWVATRGGGLLGMSRDGTLRTRFDVGRGLPSAVVLQVEVLADGRLVAGTARGPVILDPSSGSAVLPLDRHLAGASADLVVASPADASAVVQITGGDAIVGERATSSLWRVDARGATPWGEFLGPDATVTAGAVDAAGRCRLLAGTRGHWPRAESWVTRECGGAPILRIVQVGLPSPVLAVAAVGVSRNGERTAAVLVTQSSLDPRTRRHHLVEIAGDGSLESLCPGEPDLGEATALVADPESDGFVVARYGKPLLRTVTCGARAPPPAAGPLQATALAVEAGGTLWIGTSSGVLARPAADTVPRRVLDLARDGLWPDALPWDVRGDEVVVGSAARGIAVVRRAAPVWAVRRRWLPGPDLPAAVYGPVVFGDGEDLLLALKSTGVLRLSPAGRRLLAPADGLLSARVAHIAPSPAGGFWVASGSTPAQSHAGGLQLVDAPGAGVRLGGAPFTTVGDLLPWPDGRVWAATRGGVLEVSPDGSVRRLSQHRATALFRNAGSGEVAAVGSAVERWIDDRFEPVLFRIGEPGEPPPVVGHPVDVVVDDRGRWTLLYSRGALVLLDERRRFAGVVAAAQGLPASARRLLYVPDSGEILVGTGREGLFVLSRP